MIQVKSACKGDAAPCPCLFVQYILYSVQVTIVSNMISWEEMVDRVDAKVLAAFLTT